MKCGWLFQIGGFWIGIHYSTYNRRFCINPLPCVTFWVTLKGGKVPAKSEKFIGESVGT